MAFWRAWSVWAVSVAATAIASVYTAVRPLPAPLANQSGNTADWVAGVGFVAAFATVGAVLAWKRPGNPIGWLLSGTGLAYAVGVSGALLDHFPRTLVVTDWLGWIWLFGIGLCVFVVLLFPTGTLPSRRWRPVAWAAGAGLAGWVLGNAFAPAIFTVSPAVPNPVGLSGWPGDVVKLIALGGAALIAATGLAAVLSLVLRYRRARPAERAQLKWLVYAGVLVFVVVAAEIQVERAMGASNASNDLQNAMTSGAIGLLPVAIGLAVLRYRLYDIDRLISRTVAYAIITGVLAGIYAGLVLLATQVHRSNAPITVAAATLAVAALFNPVRRQVQRRVDRRFNRARYDADLTVAAFAARLKDATDRDTIRDDLASVVQTVLEPTRVSVWINDRG